MKKRFFWILIAAVTLFFGCRRDELCYLHPEGVMIELRVDWSYCRLSPNSATLIIHRADGSFYKSVEMDNPTRGLVDLPVGEYNLLVINESTHDDGAHAATLGFRGVERWEKFEVYAKDDYTTTRATSPHKVTPDTLGVDRVLNLRITQDMINRFHIHPTLEDEALHYKADTVINMLPKRPFSVTNLKINFINFKGYAISQLYPPTIHGMAESYFPASDRYSIHPVSHAISLTPILATRANTDVTSYSASFTVIGLLDGLHPGQAERPDYRLQIRLLHKGGVVIKDIDLYKEAMMDLIKEPDHSHPEDHINIEIDLELEKLSGVGEGMDAELEDWNEQDVPLDRPKNGVSDTLNSRSPAQIIK